MRLIDADKMAVEESDAYLYAQSRIKDEMTRSVNAVVHTKIQQLIADTPTVDAAEVLRGMWISVKDRLPETAEIYNEKSSEEFRLSNPVLTFGKKGFAVAMVVRDANQESFIDLDGYHISDVTHWMPLPEPPEDVLI